MRRLLLLCLVGVACLAAVARGEEQDADAEGALSEAAEAAEEGEKGSLFDTQSSDPLNSARELTDKLAQLEDLLDKSTAGGNDELKEKLKGLRKQLQGLGIDSLGSKAPTEGAEELTEFVNMCMLQAIRRAGPGRSSTTEQFKKIADPKSKLADVVDLELTRLLSVCILESTQEELQVYQKAHQEGRALTLPVRMVERAKDKDIREEILKGMDDLLWQEVKTLSAKGLDAMKEQLGTAADSGLPMFWGLLAAVPVVGAVVFLASRFLALQNQKDQKKEKKSKKKN